MLRPPLLCPTTASTDSNDFILHLQLIQALLLLILELPDQFILLLSIERAEIVPLIPIDECADDTTDKRADQTIAPTLPDLR